jgi:hypothetical protein
VWHYARATFREYPKVDHNLLLLLHPQSSEAAARRRQRRIDTDGDDDYCCSSNLRTHVLFSWTEERTSLEQQQA